MNSVKESNRIEYKLTLNNTFEKEVVAFLNSKEGGIVYIGIDDSHKIVGCEEKSLKLNEKFTTNLELLTEDGNYNYVAYLMADNNGTSIKVAKYAKTDKIDLIENNEYGYCSLIKATHKVLEKLEVENKTAALITSTTKKEQPLWDKVALREALINAIVHRRVF